MFILKLSECNKVRISAVVITNFVNFKTFCGTSTVSEYFYDFTLSLLQLCFIALSYFISMSNSSPIFITSHFLSSRILQNLSSSSIVPVVPLSLVAFSSLSCSSLIQSIFQWAEFFRVDRFRIIFSMSSLKSITWFFSSF